jgi:hypothetical protein
LRCYTGFREEQNRGAQGDLDEEMVLWEGHGYDGDTFSENVCCEESKFGGKFPQILTQTFPLATLKRFHECAHSS